MKKILKVIIPVILLGAVIFLMTIYQPENKFKSMSDKMSNKWKGVESKKK